ncbi:AGE family epimerase/isomerase [Neorhizobium galegae]|uniref:AGE family epimerase/isomerase n=1 Tax=Neorhizobium galegae TaxID=399 RepID=UPI002106628B|nr:AGE family epimerase/isomerase [Neorhizobium galegae]MCQ1834115.1 AGE family epimerase/isomerase [Neorhizobium galegae]UIY30209.1 AGE family epimerase/isomerase [Neorhizobium galegae]
MDFFEEACATYAAANAGTLYWMLQRPMLGGGFLNTKQNSLTLDDYGAEDGVRGPDYTYGWIQGRGLEAVVTHAAFFGTELSPLAEKLDTVGRRLYDLLAALQKPDGHAYFCYDRDMQAVYADQANMLQTQEKPALIYSYSDAFVAKGLVAAASRYGLPDITDHLAYFDRVITAIETGRFQMDERRPLSLDSLAVQANDFGPRMILLGAAGMLKRAGHTAHLAFADRFIAHVIDRHYDAASGLLRNVPGEDSCNVGHGIEFVGFALDYLDDTADPALIDKLERILVSSFRKGFVGPGITLTVSIETGEAQSPYCPWWSLPETIRSAALAHERTGSAESLGVWKTAHAAFFERYWRGTPPIAYQTMTKDGPVDFVPATPDLDPGYHTGLSLLAAIHAADRLKPQTRTVSG